MKLPLAVEGASDVSGSFAAGNEAPVLLITSVTLVRETRESLVMLVVPSLPPWTSIELLLSTKEVGLDVVMWLEGGARAGEGDWMSGCGKPPPNIWDWDLGLGRVECVEDMSRNVMV